jgi:hypothetical protein
MAELAAKGAEFSGGVRDEGWGHTARLKVPGAGEMTLYQPSTIRRRRLDRRGTGAAHEWSPPPASPGAGSFVCQFRLVDLADQHRTPPTTAPSSVMTAICPNRLRPAAARPPRSPSR